MKEKIAIIGSNSFSGAHFVDYTLNKRAEIIGISRSPELNPVFLPYKRKSVSSFRFYPLDLNHDFDKIMKIIQDFQPEYVVNFAAQSMVGESWKYPEHWFQTNVVATVKLHDLLRQCEFLKKYVHISTPEVYGSCDGLVQENTNYNPSTPYAVSRAATDMSLRTFFDAYDFPVVFTRAANVYGPGQQLYRIIPRAILYFMLGKKLQLHGGGHSVRSFIHIRDVADGTLRAAQMGSPGEIYHLSTTRNISIRELVQMIAKQMELPLEDNIEDVGERMGKDSAYLLDSTKSRETLGWKDQISLEQGIEETIAWVKDNLEELKKQPFDYIHKP
jgi:dTDP-glucose 4,6-dehydratase